MSTIFCRVSFTVRGTYSQVRDRSGGDGFSTISTRDTSPCNPLAGSTPFNIVVPFTSKTTAGSLIRDVMKSCTSDSSARSQGPSGLSRLTDEVEAMNLAFQYIRPSDEEIVTEVVEDPSTVLSTIPFIEFATQARPNSMLEFLLVPGQPSAPSTKRSVSGGRSTSEPDAGPEQNDIGSAFRNSSAKRNSQPRSFSTPGTISQQASGGASWSPNDAFSSKRRSVQPKGLVAAPKVTQEAHTQATPDELLESDIENYLTHALSKTLTPEEEKALRRKYRPRNSVGPHLTRGTQTAADTATPDSYVEATELRQQILELQEKELYQTLGIENLKQDNQCLQLYHGAETLKPTEVTSENGELNEVPSKVNLEGPTWDSSDEQGDGPGCAAPPSVELLLHRGAGKHGSRQLVFIDDPPEIPPHSKTTRTPPKSAQGAPPSTEDEPAQFLADTPEPVSESTESGAPEAKIADKTPETQPNSLLEDTTPQVEEVPVEADFKTAELDIRDTQAVLVHPLLQPRVLNLDAVL